MNNSPENILKEYERARRFKESLGKRGLYEQARMNERFFVGDQWHGAAVSGEKPLVRHNVIKRIGDYKISQISSADISVTYHAEGLSQNTAVRELVKKERKALSKAENSIYAPLRSENETALMVSVLNSYRTTAATRVKLSSAVEAALRDAYIKGTGVIYTYFDPGIKTGLFADKRGGTPIMGDIACQRLAIEDVYFGDPSCTDINKQPYIILTEELGVSDFLLLAKKCGLTKPRCEHIIAKNPDKVRVFTKLYKRSDMRGKTEVFAVKTTEDTVIRPDFSLGLSVYPLSVFCWEQRDNCAYGDSEITYIIPNQIAINRMITASVWSAMSSGMPLMVVNGDLVGSDITNDPGQIIKVYGDPEEINTAVQFVTPPDYSAGYNESVNNLIYNTLTQCGANEASLGDAAANNTSALIELRETSTRYLTPLKNRYYAFLEDIALIWAEFFFTMYGKRGLKITDDNGVWYFPFDASRYKDTVLTVSVTAGEGVSRSEKDTVAVLKELFERGDITPAQYIRRLPSGVIPDADRLIDELSAKEAAV